MFANERNSQTGSDGNNTKRATKRRKPTRRPGRVKNPTLDAVNQIARDQTDARIATPEEEKRLRSYVVHRWDEDSFLH